MGAFTAAAKNAMLSHIATLITHLALGTKGADRNPTALASSNTFTDNGHGYSNGDIVILSGLTGGAGLVPGRVYFVIAATTNTYQLSTTPGGSAVDITSDLTAATANRVTELSGGSYARQAIAFAAPGDGAVDDSTNGAAFPVPAGGKVNYVLGMSAATDGTVYDVDEVDEEVFANEGTYTVTDKKMDLNGGA